nr:MAG TPA: hypothetical protein [Bacteriophage sp.]
MKTFFLHMVAQLKGCVLSFSKEKKTHKKRNI